MFNFNININWMKYALEDYEMSLIKKLEMEASKLSWVVSLAQGIPWYSTPEPIVEYVLEKIRNWETNRYSSAYWIPQLREQIALKYYKDYDIELNYDKEIIVTAWAIQGISVFLQTIIRPEDEVILLDPSYASYTGCVKTAKWNPVYVPLDENLDIDLEKLFSNINEKTRAIIISNPNNPTWSIFDIKTLRQILEQIKWTSAYLVLDEVYDEFLFDDNNYESVINLYKEYKSNLLIVNSWSKSFGMTWWRVGYIIWDQRLCDEIVKVHDSMITCAPVHSQWAAIASFEIYESRCGKARTQLQKRRDYTMERLKDLEWYINFSKPKAAYFLFPEFTYTNDDYSECLKILQEVKVALVPGSWFGNRGKWSFRLCFGRDFEDLEEWLERLRNYFWK